MLKIKKVIELDVDLNAYYPQFPKKLRDAIDDAVIALGSGDPKERTVGVLRGRTPIHDSDIMVVTGKVSSRTTGHLRRISQEFNRRWKAKEPVMVEDVVKVIQEEAKSAGKTLSNGVARSWMRNMVREGYLEWGPRASH